MTALSVVEKAVASSIVYCSQYRMEDYELQNGPLPGHEKVGGWLRDVQAAYASDRPSPYPTPPGAARHSAQGSIHLGLGLGLGLGVWP